MSKSKWIVVVTGAGISCSCGIPGITHWYLYTINASLNLKGFSFFKWSVCTREGEVPDAIMKGRNLFHAVLFRVPMSTALFYTFMAKPKSSIDFATLSPTHYFNKTLDTKGKFLSHTQNIDGLEERTGPACSSSESVKNTGNAKGKLKTKEVQNVQLHGDIHRVRCLMCAANFKCTSEYLEAFREGNPPDCPECKTRYLKIRSLITIKSSDPFDALIDPKYLNSTNDVALLVCGLKLLIKLANTEPMLSALKQDDNPLLDHNLGKPSDNDSSTAAGHPFPTSFDLVAHSLIPHSIHTDSRGWSRTTN
ncbi:DHS-like NAD/FAD-binding domain-containing protein [Hysterangium stoloniferum]|nr:DHS-like NAD/FAD-binding domain-containing protein [Hysterangium stoloniferum]